MIIFNEPKDVLIDLCKDRVLALFWKYQDHIFETTDLIAPNDFIKIIRHYDRQDPDLDMKEFWKQYDDYIDIDNIEYFRQLYQDYNPADYGSIDTE
jgi:hypothetical protein